MSAASTSGKRINPRIVLGAEKGGSGDAAKGLSEAGGKRGGYKVAVKPGWDYVSSNSGGRRRPTRGTYSTGGDLAAGSPKGGASEMIGKGVVPEEIAGGDALKEVKAESRSKTSEEV